MAFKTNIDPITRGFFFSTGGDDANDGLSIERPKRTIAATEAAALALIPAPDPTNPATVIAAQGGNFTDPVFLDDFVLFNGRDITLDTDAPISVDFANVLNFDITTTTNIQNNSITYNMDTVVSAGARALFVSNTGTNSTVVNITGVCNNIFIDLNQMAVGGVGGTGVKCTFSTTNPVDINIPLVLLDAINTTFMEFDPVNANDAATIEVSSISGGNTGTTGFLVKNGLLTVSCNLLLATTAIKVESGATLDFIAQEVDGDIIVDAGSILNCSIPDHTGSITNNGTINGVINGIPFGNARQKPEQEFELTGTSFSTQSPTGTNVPLQVEFGAAQFGSSDPVDIDVLGNITINQTDQYVVDILFHAGRVGAGSFAIVFFRLLINGTQIGDSTSIRLDNANTHFQVEISETLDLIATEVLTVEIWRDPSGFDAGSLFSETPTLAASNPVPSAAITITISRLTQPV